MTYVSKGGDMDRDPLAGAPKVDEERHAVAVVRAMARGIPLRVARKALGAAFGAYKALREAGYVVTPEPLRLSDSERALCLAFDPVQTWADPDWAREFENDQGQQRRRLPQDARENASDEA